MQIIGIIALTTLSLFLLSGIGLIIIQEPELCYNLYYESSSIVIDQNGTTGVFFYNKQNMTKEDYLDKMLRLAHSNRSLFNSTFEVWETKCRT